MKFRTHSIILIIFIILLFFSCGGGNNKIEIEGKASAKALFEKGMSLNNKEKARLYFRKITQLYPNSSYTPEAKYQIGYSYYKDGGFENIMMAIQEFSDFVSVYPSHPLAPQAQFYLAEGYFRMKRSPGRDQTNTKRALSEFKKLISMYPLTPQAKKAKEYVEKCEKLLGEHVFLIAKYYFKTKAYKASEKRFKQILKLYPDYPGKDKIYWYLGQLKYETKEYEKCLEYFNMVLQIDPKHKYGYKTKKFLDDHKKEIKNKIESKQENKEKKE